MNIFILDKNIELNAQYHADKHVRKMILEYAQILSTVHHICDTPTSNRVYRATHNNHPCVKWASESLPNYRYVWLLLGQLLAEFDHRFGKEHKTNEVWSPLNPVIAHTEIEHFQNNPDDYYVKSYIQCVPTPYRCTSVVEAYRAYYNGEKQHLFQWTNRPIPYWVEKI